MSLVIAWSLLHRRLESGSTASDNFLVVAPNVIVYERLREDFESAAMCMERVLRANDVKHAAGSFVQISEPVWEAVAVSGE